MHIEPILMEPILIEPILIEPILMEPILMEPFKSYNHLKLYNHFKGSKKAFNYNPYNGIKLNRFRLLAMLERLKSAINKIIILKGYKNILIFKIIIIKIMSLISDNDIIILLIRNNDIFIPDKFTKD